MTLGRSVGLSDTGRKRRHNEDAYVMEPPLFAIADGMGGAQAGEIASRLAAETIRKEAGSSRSIEMVTSLVQAANRRVYDRARQESGLSGMGTTMTVALVEDGVVSIAHVGDSRAYLIREGTLSQLTEDHSLVAELIRSGKLSPEEAERHPQRSVITRALGTDPDVDVDVYTVEPQPGDLFLLCSDGLTSMVGDETILEIAEENRHDLDAAARALIARANRGGGEDNITVIFFDIAEEGAEPAETEPRPPRPTAEQPIEADEEDTLSGIERVPAVGTMIVSLEQLAAGQTSEIVDQPTEAAPEPRPRRARRVVATLAVIVLVAAVVALVLWGLVL
jgi:PPM family protein phosphatase